MEGIAIAWLKQASQKAVAEQLHLSWDEIHGIMERAVELLQRKIIFFVSLVNLHYAVRSLAPARLALRKALQLVPRCWLRLRSAANIHKTISLSTMIPPAKAC
jgi:Helix-turn-helix domain of transposase family ISL3